jgi:hypothetical protein
MIEYCRSPRLGPDRPSRTPHAPWLALRRGGRQEGSAPFRETLRARSASTDDGASTRTCCAVPDDLLAQYVCAPVRHSNRLARLPAPRPSENQDVS